MPHFVVRSSTLTVTFSAAVAMAVCLLFVLPAHAQVNRCVDQAGKVQFSNLGCPTASSGRIVDVRPNAIDTTGMRRQNQAELTAQQRRRQEETAVPSPQAATSRNECPSAREVRNMEVSASSLSLKKLERDFYEAEIRRARQCQAGEGNYSAAAWKASKEALDDQRSVDAEVRRRARARAEGFHSAANPREGDRIADERIAQANREAARRQAATAAALRASQTNLQIASCDRSGCWDNLGGRYTGSGSALMSNTGRTCKRVENMLQCL